MPHFRLAPHPLARDQAIATVDLSPGSTILVSECLASALLLSEKGKRCDACHVLCSKDVTLRKCSNCASYWYCGLECQNRHWKFEHKKICNEYARWIAGPGCSTLQSHERLDAILLSHLVAQWYTHSVPFPPGDETDSLFSMFMSLLPWPPGGSVAPHICYIKSPTSLSLSTDALNALYSRFGNNNFVLHSHLNSYAHGIFPSASRAFNHSCVPNAVAKYIIERGRPVRMVVVALRGIEVGEEICIPYLDPAMLQSRRRILELSYGFRCTCASCNFMERVGSVDVLTQDSHSSEQREASLLRFVFPSSRIVSEFSWNEIPHEIIPLLRESYIESLSGRFSKAAHEGDYDIALDSGLTLLALYLVIYPPKYPQIGMHLLEMAKTAWNASLMANGGNSKQPRISAQLATSSLRASCEVLDVFGLEGDEGGPMVEIKTLQSLLSED